MIEISKITINGYENSCFSEKPIRISWQMNSDRRDVRQTAYRIQIAGAQDFEEILWDSGEVLGGDSQLVETEGFEPRHLDRYFARVMIRENHGEISPWSPCIDFLYLCPGEIPWKARWVSARGPLAQGAGGIYIRKSFQTDKIPCRGFLISSAKGIYRPYLDGTCITDELLLPGWTAYENRIQYQIWEITDRLREGNRHMLGAVLAPGWFRGRLGETGRGLYGDRTAWMAQVYLSYEDGSEEWIFTDDACECHESPLLMADLYDGEEYDARREIEDWSCPEGSGEEWLPVETSPVEGRKLWPQKIRGVRPRERFLGKVFETPAGEVCVDFGQNMAGVVDFQVQGNPGDKVEFTCFEALDKEGNVYTQNLRSAKQTITYYCRGGGQERYMSGFSYQGFRYIQIHSWPGELEGSPIQARAIYSDMGFHGTFTSSHRLLNRLTENICWSMKSNFVDIPTDCPQRDERLGWTGDAQIFSETAVYFANVFGFYEKWLLDVAGEQRTDGGVPHLVPDILRFEDQSGDWLLSQGTHSAAAWADAIVLIPWRLYQYYGNQKILECFYENMRRWIDFMQRHSEGYLWNYRLQFGDWLALDAPEGSYFGATPNELTCTAYFAYSTGVFQKIAGILGREKDHARYGRLYQSIRKAFCQRFLGKDGLLRIRTQTALALALHFDLLPREAAGKNAAELVGKIREDGNHMTTGFMGTPCILAALSENGFVEEAYELLLREDYPSWLYQVKMGATTVWEHLDGRKPDGSMWSSDMNSFNHYAYGAVASWLFQQAAGINLLEEAPGFARFVIEPKLSQRLPEGNAAIETPYGKIAVSWEQRGDQWSLTVQIPPNTRAELRLKPEMRLWQEDGLRFTEADGYQKAPAGSGTYRITFGTSIGINKVQSQ